ncbi:hypothetical protein [Geodermatophilus sabuli]|uniref:Uncharacterized protein n=1 Tax=Geodermatophilus sabuli TaxID=1564158 RepID=A0A285ED47_9ACTN|nr:hypothetical protein [Geodermatophilus sabuli]MBB3084750.1 hypothetical protein [Geodermatophilus sabuli]SNX97062.1 hypothetical protein SAMN06893097_10611 [Geodermatophilus sabuli]
MTEPSRPRPVPGPPRPGLRPAPVPGPPAPAAPPAARSAEPEAVRGAEPEGPEAAGAPTTQGDAFAGLAERPLAEHVAAFEAEHARLQRELATIDQL